MSRITMYTDSVVGVHGQRQLREFDIVSVGDEVQTPDGTATVTLVRTDSRGADCHLYLRFHQGTEAEHSVAKYSPAFIGAKVTTVYARDNALTALGTRKFLLTRLGLSLDKPEHHPMAEILEKAFRKLNAKELRNLNTALFLMEGRTL